MIKLLNGLGEEKMFIYFNPTNVYYQIKIKKNNI